MVGACALCRSEAALRQSHIIPEFAYKPIYDEKHRIIAFSPAAPEEKEYEQKGLRSRLLCDICEGFLSREYEAPFKEYWFDQGVLDRIIGRDLVILDDVDYAKFKLFHLSILWRASVTDHPAFYQVELGPHGEKIRQLLLPKSPGSAWEYPIVGSAIIGRDGNPCDQLVFSPQQLRLYGHRGFLLTYCGCQWLVVVSSHRNAEIERVSLQETGRMPIVARDLREVFGAIHKQVSRHK